MYYFDSFDNNAVHVHHYHQLARVDDDFVITEMNDVRYMYVHTYISND